MDKQIAIIGAGWAGCATAVELVNHGFNVTLFEASHIPGGRARRVVIDNVVLDNGQHILLGAYSETLNLMQSVGVDLEKAFLRLPLQIRYPEKSRVMDFVTTHLPAPWHLLTGLFKSKGLKWKDKIALARFFTACRMIRWDIGKDRTVLSLLEQFWQTPRLYGLLWRPLCLAALNALPEDASAKVFLAILRDSIGKERSASDILIPKVNLSALFPDKAVDYILSKGSHACFGETIRKVDYDGTGWTLNGHSDKCFDALVVATSAPVAASLLGDFDIPGLNELEFEPITTCYLKYANKVRLPAPFYTLLDYPDRQKWGQYVFDRGQIVPGDQGLLSVVISASSIVGDMNKEILAKTVAAQLAESFQQPELFNSLWSHVITEKRATFKCLPDLKRPDNMINEKGLFLVGDYTESEYPCTLETAVISGKKVAKKITKNFFIIQTHSIITT